MKSFFKYVLATIVGFVIINILVFVLFFGFIGALATMGDKTVEIKDNSIVQVDAFYLRVAGGMAYAF